MPKVKIAIIAVLAAIVIIQAANYIKNYSRKTNSTGSNKSVPQSENQNPSSGLEAQTNGEGPVSVQVTPADLTQDKWKFEIVLNTHSVELDYDLTQLVVLVDSSGNQYKPAAWEGDPPGGHHREGVLIFEAPNPKPLSIILQINNIGSIERRAFFWNIK